MATVFQCATLAGQLHAQATWFLVPASCQRHYCGQTALVRAGQSKALLRAQLWGFSHAITFSCVDAAFTSTLENLENWKLIKAQGLAAATLYRG